MCRKVIYSVQVKFCAQNLVPTGTDCTDVRNKRAYALRRTRPDFFYGISRTGRRRQQSVERKLFPAGCSETHSVCKKMQAI